MQGWITDIMKNYEEYTYLGYIIIALLIAVENIFPPIPSEVILTFGGFMTTYTSLTVWGVILSATIGAVAGAIILYGIGRLLSVDRITKLLDGKIGKLLRLKKQDVFKACEWFNKKGKVTVLICRCVPILRSLISVPAGMTKMNFNIFLALTVAGTFVWNIVLVYLGVFAGDSWEKIVANTDTYTKITVIVLGILAVIAAFVFIKMRMKKSDKDDNK